MKIIGKDEIALEAMKCLIDKNPSMYPDALAKRAYEIADGFIFERNKRYAENYVLNAAPDSAPTVQKE